MKRYEAYKDSEIEWIGAIPQEWSIARNKNVFKCKKDIVGEKWAHTQLLSLTTQGIKQKDADNPEGKLPESFEGYQIVHVDDLVMCLFDLDLSAVFSGLSGYEGMISPAYRVLTPCGIVPKFASYWFEYVFHGRKFVQYSKTLRSTLTYDEFGALPILLPPLKEQKAIADYLHTKTADIDALIADCEREVELLQEYRKAIITEAVTRGLNPTAPMKNSDVEWIPETPETWTPFRMSALFREVAETGYPDLPILTVSINTGISDGELNDDQLERKVNRSDDRSVYKRVLKGDIAYNMMRAWQGSIGASRVDGIVSPAYTVLRPRSEGVALAPFIEYLLRTQSAIEELRRRSYGIADFRLRLYWQYFKDMIVYLPPIEEQEEIVGYLNTRVHELDELSGELRLMAELLRDYRKSLIDEAVTGRFEVSVL